MQLVMGDRPMRKTEIRKPVKTDTLRDCCRVAERLMQVGIRDILREESTASGDQRVIRARWLVAWLGIRVLGRSQPEWARFMGLDHTSARHGMLSIERLSAKDPEWAARCEQARAMLAEQRELTQERLRQQFVIGADGVGRAL